MGNIEKLRKNVNGSGIKTSLKVQKKKKEIFYLMETRNSFLMLFN